MGRYVAAALGQVIEVPKAGSSYEKRKTTYLKHTIDKALQEATKAAVARVLAEEAPALEEAVRKELRRNIAAVAEQLVGSVKKSAESSYGITVELKMPRN
jgi:predicted trehalose synthase